MTQETSKQAYFTEVLPTLADRHRKVLEVLSTVPDATNSELSRMLGWEINRVTPRVNELAFPKEKDVKPLIQQAYKRPCKITGRTAIAWKVVGLSERNASNYRCSHCSKDAVTFLESSAVCQAHSVREVAPSLF